MGRLHQQGTAIIGGDVSGNTRGANAIDIQTGRGAVTQVVSGERGIAIGHSLTVSGDYGCIALGVAATAGAGYGNLAAGYAAAASGGNAFAIGPNTVASAYNTIAVGYSSEATAEPASAFGFGSIASIAHSAAIGTEARARVAFTTNICGPQINRKDDGEAAGQAFYRYPGVEGVLMTKEVDLKVVADQTITLPANCKFWFDECGLIATDIDTLTVQPTIRFGITGTPAKQNAAAITTAITAAGKREIETPLVPEDGETSLVAGVTVAATATTAKGRFYFRGLLVEDE